VHHSCALTLTNIFEHCTTEMSNEILIEVFYVPLENLINGGNNKMAQVGAAHCILEFFLHLQRKGNTELMMLILPKYLNLFIVTL